MMPSSDDNPLDSLSVRAEAATDITGIFSLNARCFPTPAEARLVDLLRKAKHLTVSAVAVDEGQIIGHVAFSPVTAGDGQTGLGLAPLAVDEHYRRQGIAAELVRFGLKQARELGIGWIVVLGEPSYYSRFGFQPASSFGLCDEYGGGEAFQVLELTPDSLPRDAGLVRYAPEFASLEES